MNNRNFINHTVQDLVKNGAININRKRISQEEVELKKDEEKCLINIDSTISINHKANHISRYKGCQYKIGTVPSKNKTISLRLFK